MTSTRCTLSNDSTKEAGHGHMRIHLSAEVETTRQKFLTVYEPQCNPGHIYSSTAGPISCHADSFQRTVNLKLMPLTNVQHTNGKLFQSPLGAPLTNLAVDS